MHDEADILDVSQVLSQNAGADSIPFMASGSEPQPYMAGYSDHTGLVHIDRRENSTISGRIKVASLNANRSLAAEIAKRLGCKLCDCNAGKFADGETYTSINETIRGADMYIVQPTSPPVNDNLMELLIMIDALRRASAGHINVVMPYFGYARQDRKARARDPISAKLIANLVTTAGATRVITMDLHCPQIQGFFDIPVDNLMGFPILAKYYTDKLGGALTDTVVVAPDLGSVPRGRALAERLNIPMAIIDKRRPKPNQSEVLNVIGEIRGKRVIIADDMIDTAGTLVNAAVAVENMGAGDIYACCTHAVLSGGAVTLIDRSPIKEVAVLDTVPVPEEKRIDKINVLPVADIFSEAIWRIHNGMSVSTLFI